MLSAPRALERSGTRFKNDASQQFRRRTHMKAITFGNCDCCSITGVGGLETAAGLSTDESELKTLFDKVSNWGRWGADDQRGTLNHIGPDEIARAAALVREGRTVSLSRAFPTQPGAENPRPAQHFMMVTGEDRQAPHLPGMEASFDYIGIAFHGLVCTHLDALCHILDRKSTRLNSSH